jgi:DNA-binding NarL/FixJ family response regulator
VTPACRRRAADPHPHTQRLVRAGLRVLPDHEAGIAVVDEAATGDEAVALTRRLQPNVVLLDVRLPDSAVSKSRGGSSPGPPSP